MKISFRLAASVALASIAACGHTNTHRVVTGQTGAPHRGDVALYMAGTSAPPFDEVAIVQAVGNGAHADLEHVVAGLKEEAARLGCNALANVKIDQGTNAASGTAICARLRAQAPGGHAPPPRVAPAATPGAAPGPATGVPVDGESRPADGDSGGAGTD